MTAVPGFGTVARQIMMAVLDAGHMARQTCRAAGASRVPLVYLACTSHEPAPPPRWPAQRIAGQPPCDLSALIASMASRRSAGSGSAAVMMWLPAWIWTVR